MGIRDSTTTTTASTAVTNTATSKNRKEELKAQPRLGKQTCNQSSPTDPTVKPSTITASINAASNLQKRRHYSKMITDSANNDGISGRVVVRCSDEADDARYNYRRLCQGSCGKKKFLQVFSRDPSHNLCTMCYKKVHL